MTQTFDDTAHPRAAPQVTGAHVQPPSTRPSRTSQKATHEDPTPHRTAVLVLSADRQTIAMESSDDDRSLVKSRHRVKTYGEVFTPRAMVDQMLDLVSEELEKSEGFVDNTFFEPAAGDGNFLVAILQRKLAAIEKRLDPSVWSRESLFALASIYAIELLEDNHRDAQDALVNEFVRFHESHSTSSRPDTDLHRAAVFLVQTNIVRGNTLTGRTPHGDEIEFSWWIRHPDDPAAVTREPFRYNALRETDRFDFTTYASFAPCPIDRVHEETTADG